MSFVDDLPEINTKEDFIYYNCHCVHCFDHCWYGKPTTIIKHLWEIESLTFMIGENSLEYGRPDKNQTITCCDRITFIRRRDPHCLWTENPFCWLTRMVHPLGFQPNFIQSAEEAGDACGQVLEQLNRAIDADPRGSILWDGNAVIHADLNCSGMMATN